MNSMKMLVSVLLFTLSVACSKSGDGDTVTPAAKGTLTAQVDGQAFTATDAVSTYDKNSKDLTVTGGDNTHLTGFTLEGFSGPGTVALVDISQTGSTGSYTDMKSNTTYTLKEGRTGTVTVTSFTGSTIEGTFSMKTYNSQSKREVVVSGGSFKLPVLNL